MVTARIGPSVGQPLDDWAIRGACVGAPPSIFFPDKGGTSGPAKAYCRRCPVARQCLDFALRTHQNYGVWGGLTVRQRAALKRTLRML